MKPGQELTVFDKSSGALEQAVTLDDIKAIRDKAEAVRKYAKSAALGLEAQNRAAELKLRAERKAGQLLKEMCLRGGDRKSNRQRDRLKLEDLGITQNQSTRWQLQAALSEQDFELFLSSSLEAQLEITSAAVLSLARKAKRSSATNGTVDRATPTSLASRYSKCLIDGTDKFEAFADTLSDLANHANQLNQILEPLYTSNGPELSPVHRRYLARLVPEILTLIRRLQHLKQASQQ